VALRGLDRARARPPLSRARLPRLVAVSDEIPLPPPRLRMGGAHFASDEDFVAGGVRDVRLLAEVAGLTRDSRLLDWGCGAGRLAIGVKHEWGQVADYHGVDVQKKLVRWARNHLADDHTRFTLVDQHNDRYNPEGKTKRRIPADDGSVDVLYSYSVFSHMLTDDVAGYAQVMARVLAPDGRIWLTCFVEDGVPDCVENPQDYLKLDWRGPLHCVRFDREFFESLMTGAGLRVDRFEHGQETDGQSMYVLAHA
jgi:cyclopropane fatty-acyl-phospholipid synthase-like methyltransferase